MRRLLLAGVAIAVLGAAVVSLSSDAGATVTTSTRAVTYSPSSPTTVFTVTFPFLAASHLVVTKTTIASGAVVTLTQGTDYAVTLPVGSTNGYITTTAPVTTTHRITITRTVPLTQTTSFKNQGTFSPAAHEAAFDKLTMVAQQIQALATDEITQTDIDDAIDTHEALADPHSVYAKMAGRSGGQTFIGGTASGNNLVLQTSSNATKGKVLIGSAGTEFVVDDVNDRVGIGTASPSVELDVAGAGKFTDTMTLGGGAGAITLTDSASSIVLPDNDATALLIGSTGQLGLLTIDTGNSTETVVVNGTTAVKAFDVAVGTSNFAEAVTMGTTLGVTGLTTVTGGITSGLNAVTGADTLTSADCGRITTVTAGIDGNTIVLPEAGTVIGCTFSIMYIGADAGALLDISPLDSDADGIEGGCTLAASVVTMSGTADADVGLTKATILTGDSLKLTSVSSSMYVMHSVQGICANN